MLDAGITYLFGSEADYLLEGAIERTPGEVSYTVTRSRTNTLNGRLGLASRRIRHACPAAAFRAAHNDSSRIQVCFACIHWLLRARNTAS